MKLNKKLNLLMAIVLIIVISATLVACGSKQLAAPTNVAFDISTGIVTFDKVADAEKYVITTYKVASDGDEVINSVTVTNNEATVTLSLGTAWSQYYVKVYAVGADSSKILPSTATKSALVKYDVFSAPMYRVVKSATSANPNYVWIQLNPAQFLTVYEAVQAVPSNIEFKIYSGATATGTAIFTKTIAGSSLSVTGTSGDYTASAGFTFAITSALSALGNYTMTAQVIGGSSGTNSTINTYTYNYTAHAANVTNTNAGTYTSVSGYTFTSPA